MIGTLLKVQYSLLKLIEVQIFYSENLYSKMVRLARLMTYLKRIKTKEHRTQRNDIDSEYWILEI